MKKEEEREKEKKKKKGQQQQQLDREVSTEPAERRHWQTEQACRAGQLAPSRLDGYTGVGSLQAAF